MSLARLPRGCAGFPRGYVVQRRYPHETTYWLALMARAAIGGEVLERSPAYAENQFP